MTPEWEADLRAALERPGPPGHYWHRPTDWTIEQAVKAMRPHVNKAANWPHEEPFDVVDGRCQVCGYKYEDEIGAR